MKTETLTQLLTVGLMDPALIDGINRIVFTIGFAWSSFVIL